MAERAHRPRRLSRVARALLIGYVVAAHAISARATTPWGERFERIVAVVDKDVITEGELTAEARLALVMREGQKAAFVPLSDAYMQTFLQHLISQVLVAQEARRMGGDGILEADVNARLSELRSKFSGQKEYLKFLGSLAMDAYAVRATMARDVQNDRYIKERLQSRLLMHAHDSPSLSLGEREAKSEPTATQQAEAKVLRRWLADLRRGAQVRVLDAQGRLRLERH